MKFQQTLHFEMSTTKVKTRASKLSIPKEEYTTIFQKIQQGNSKNSVPREKKLSGAFFYQNSWLPLLVYVVSLSQQKLSPVAASVVWGFIGGVIHPPLCIEII